MSTPPGSYDSLNALDAATPLAPPAIQAATPLAASAAAPFESQTRPPLFTFSPQGAMGVSMQGFYINQDDNLVIGVWNSSAAVTTVNVQVRVLRPDGSLIYEAFSCPNVLSTRQVAAVNISQLEGFIVGVVVQSPGPGVVRGQTYVTVKIARGAVGNSLANITLVADYLSTAFQPSWPYGGLRGSTDGPGLAYGTNGGIPLAGADASVSVPTNARWSVLSVKVHLLTDAVAGNRQVSLLCIDSGGTAWEIGATTTQGPSLGYDYTWAPGLQFNATVPTEQCAPMPMGVLLPAGSTLTATMTGRDAGDQFSAVAVALQEWIDV